MSIQSIQVERGLSLPQEYLKLLSSLDEADEYCFNEYPQDDPDFEGRCWCFLNEEELNEEIDMPGVGKSPAHKQLEIYIKCFIEYSDNQFLTSPNGRVPIQCVINGFVIAEDNGDLLYLDPLDDFSVWIFHHDGSDVMKVANSIGDWQSRAVVA
mgnify:FL=1|tara:strand:+ start:558 stop:1019 length:462 start_codon:yes stop_codon:yes gene_type:complete